MPKPEDQVALDAVQAQQERDADISLGRVIDAIPKFKQVTDLGSFRAEYTLQDGQDIIVHFFMPARQTTSEYWTVRFPTALDVIARSHFEATKPRLQAKYTPDLGLNSWWFKAQGYGHLIDVEGFIRKFFEKLDAVLQSRP